MNSFEVLGLGAAGYTIAEMLLPKHDTASNQINRAFVIGVLGVLAASAMYFGIGNPELAMGTLSIAAGGVLNRAGKWQSMPC